MCGLCGVRGLLIDVRGLSCVACCILWVMGWLLFGVRCLMFLVLFVWCWLCDVCCLAFGVRRFVDSLLVVSCLSFVAFCLLCVVCVCGLLFVVSCLFFEACCCGVVCCLTLAVCK